MNEDDTFRILARPNIEQMVVLHGEWVGKHMDNFQDYSSLENIKFCKYYGWTWVEFLKARKELNSS